MIKLDYQSREPIYRQIKASLTEQILLGAYPPQSKLPSVRTLAGETGINPNTIQKAYQELEAEGIIYSVSGKGNFVREGDSARAVMQERLMAELTQLLRQAKNAGISEDAVHQQIIAVYTGGEAE